jgi:hypothetical protein
MPLNPSVYTALLAELSKINHTSIPDPFRGRLNVPTGRAKAMIHESIVQSEIEMRMALEQQYHEEHSASSLTTDGGGPKAVSRGPTYDSDAQIWFDAVTANGGDISTANKTAFNTAFLSLKSAGLWNNMVLAGFLCGVNNKSGINVPIVNRSSATISNNGFLDSDYSRLLGLKGDGLTKYLSTTLSNNDSNLDPNNRHLYAYVTTAPSTQWASGYAIASGSTGNGTSRLLFQNSGFYRVWVNTANNAILSYTIIQGSNYQIGGYGAYRTNAANVFVSYPQVDTLFSNNASTNAAGNFGIFATSTGSTPFSETISFYVIGGDIQQGQATTSLYNPIISTLMSSLT